jgi:hypothetical protein
VQGTALLVFVRDLARGALPGALEDGSLRIGGDPQGLRLQVGGGAGSLVLSSSAVPRGVNRRRGRCGEQAPGQGSPG